MSTKTIIAILVIPRWQRSVQREKNLEWDITQYHQWMDVEEMRE